MRFTLFPALARCATLCLLPWLWTGCALQGPAATDAAESTQADDAAAATTPAPDAWHAVALPGKLHTRYSAAHKDGRAAIAAVSERSASMWRRKLHLASEELGEVSFSWWVPHLMSDASVADVDREDASARVMFAFEGDTRRLSSRNRMLFDLAEALTGERPPFATLMYVWDATAPVGTVIINPRTDRVRKIVVDSGFQQLRRWRDHRRNLSADFKTAFGEAPGPLLSIAFMTDSDNTRSQAQAWYGPVDFHQAVAPLHPAPPR